MTDYKKLCEELQAENERLKKRLDGLSGVSEMLKSCCREYYDHLNEGEKDGDTNG